LVDFLKLLIFHWRGCTEKRHKRLSAVAAIQSSVVSSRCIAFCPRHGSVTAKQLLVTTLPFNLITIINHGRSIQRYRQHIQQLIN